MLMPRYLAGLVDLPYVTPSGRLVTKPGYDAETCLFLDLPRDLQISVGESPTQDQVRAALVVLMGPWRAYSFADRDSAAGAVSAVFAAVSRPLLDLCPAYLYEASQQAAGKTKAATALGALMEGQRPAVTPFAGTSTDDELRKRLIAGAVDGDRFQCIDNVVGHFKSSVLAAVLTGGRLSDRVLGQSRMVKAQVRSLLTMTGNNASLDADLQRRTVQIRIESGSNPTQHAFPFCPVAEALCQRRAIAEAACTVLRAYFAAGSPDIVAGNAGGFAAWNRLCRQPVLWLASEGLADVLPWQLGDPAGSMLADASTSDPDIEDTRDLLRALLCLTDGEPFTSSNVMTWFRAGEGHNEDESLGLLHATVVSILGRKDVTAKRLGWALKNRRDRVVGGIKLLVKGDKASMRTWRVVVVEA